MSKSSPATRDAVIDAGVALLCVLPLLLPAHLPLSDVPNHLARQYILRDLAQSEQLQQFYAIHWALVPNLALEIFVQSVHWVLPLPVATRLFCIITVVLLFLGTRWVNQYFSQGQGRAYRAVPILCWGGPMQYGFLSYCFGIGLGVVCLGAWLRLRQRSMPVRIGFLLAAGTILMLCHLAAFGLFAIAVGMCELADRWRITRVVVPVISLTAVFLVFSWFSPTSGSVSGSPVEFSDLHDKVRSFASITFFSSLKLEGGILVAALAGLLLALVTRVIRWNRIGLYITGTMGLVWLITPTFALDANYIDYRLPWAISFFALASLVPGVPHTQTLRWARPVAVWFGILSVARIALISLFWIRWEPILAGIDQALAQLPHGARIMTVVGEPATKSGFRDPDLTNVASYAVIRRQAFEPGMFASISGQILQFQPHYRALARADGFPETTLSRLTSLAPDYNYVLVVMPELAEISPDVAGKLVSEAQGKYFELFKVAKQGG